MAGVVAAMNGVNCTRLAVGDRVWGDIGANARPLYALNHQQEYASRKEYGGWGEYSLGAGCQMCCNPLYVAHRNGDGGVSRLTELSP